MPDDSHGDRILLALRGVTKRYGGVHALTGVNFVAAPVRSMYCSARTARGNRR